MARSPRFRMKSSSQRISVDLPTPMVPWIRKFITSAILTICSSPTRKSDSSPFLRSSLFTSAGFSVSCIPEMYWSSLSLRPMPAMYQAMATNTLRLNVPLASTAHCSSLNT